MIEDFSARPLYERSAIIHAETIKFNVNELLSGISFPNEELKSQVLVNLYSFFIACNEEILHFSDDENTQTFLRLSKSISDEDNFSKIIKKESQYISLWMNSLPDDILSPRCEDVPILCSVVSNDLASLLVISQSALFSCFQQYLRDLSCEDSSRYKQILNGVLPSSQADYLSTPHTFSCSISFPNSPKSFSSTVKKKHVPNETAEGCGCLSVLLVIYLLIAFFGG